MNASPTPAQAPTQTPTVVVAAPPAPPKRSWFRRHKILTVILAVIVLGIIGAAASNGNGKGNDSGSSGPSTSDVSPSAAPSITGKVSGEFQDRSSCLGCGSLINYIHTDKIWCGWQGDQVLIHVRFRNESVEHATINWHPSYTITDGGSHGSGLSSLQSSGIDGHSTRTLIVKQSPQGVPVGSAIGQCDPAFYDVSSG